MTRKIKINLWNFINCMLAIACIATAPKLINSNHPITGWGLYGLTVSSVTAMVVTSLQARSKAQRISEFLEQHGIIILFADLLNLPSLDISNSKLREVAELAQRYDFDESQVLALLAQK